jgi:hypothetical protein
MLVRTALYMKYSPERRSWGRLAIGEVVRIDLELPPS